ncbi:MAG: pentapeptide repeat-containing protein, partial [Planctomycetes bacterium]|nr:pentapeptide repeat-containing protein [Planctomycetota bacterium]
ATSDNVTFYEFTDWGNRFDRCSFGHAIFRQAALGFGMSVFAGCVFQRGNFRGAIFKRPEFDQCQFLSCDFRGVDFDASSFVDCAFVGKLNGAWFRGGYGYPELSESYGRARQNNMLRVSWAAAKIWQVTFSDECDLSTVILPTDGKHFRYDRWPERVEAACAKFNDCDNADLGRAYNFVRSFQPHAQSQAWYILNYDDIANLVGNEVAPLVLAAFGDPA